MGVCSRSAFTPPTCRTVTGPSSPSKPRAPASPSCKPCSRTGYAGRLEVWARAKANVALSVVKRPRALSGFEPLPRRWVIERSFAWLIKNRRLVRDFEQCPETSEALITIAAATTLIRRLR